jgi:hypothetical protein
MFDDLYYYGLNFFEQNGLFLILGAIMLCLGVYIYQKKEESKVAIGLIIVGTIILLWNGIFTLLYFLFFIALGIAGGFALYYYTKK